MAVMALFIFGQAHAQFDYSPTGVDDVPLLGLQWGLTGGGFTAMMPNRDDQNAKTCYRLEPQMMNFSYAAGVEAIYWFQKTVGFGGQALLWNGGASYKGYDSTALREFTGKTSLGYAKLPLLFHFKSFNRFKPNRRLRLNTYFGPYVALLSSYTDEATYGGDPYYDVSGTNIEVPGFKGFINSGIYSTIDVGFVTGIGFEFRLWKRTVLAFSVRADYGIVDAEDKRAKKFKLIADGPETDFNPWKNLYAKYVPATAADFANGFGVNRPASKNFSVGGFISLRKYTQQ